MKRLVAAAAVLTVPWLMPTASPAGTYEVRACDLAAGVNNSWTPANHSPATLAQAEVCPSGGAQYNGLRTFDQLGSPNTPAESEAVFHLDAPAGTSITGATLRRWIGKDTSNSWIPFVRADGSVLETCTIPGGEFNCQVGAPGGSDQDYPTLSAGRLSVGVRCGQTPPNTCSTGGTIHHAWAVLYGAAVTLTDPTPPVIGVDSAGSSLFGGWVNGIQQLRLSANDGESGVRELQILDGAQIRHAFAVPEAAGGCGTPNAGAAYTFTQPCAGARGLNGARTLEVDTGAWPSRLHTDVYVRAVDAGGELAQAGPFSVGVDRDPPTGLRFTGLPSRSRVRAGRRITGISARAEDPLSGLAAVDIEWRNLTGPGSAAGWRPYVAGSEPIARRGRRYQFRARASDRIGNRSDYVSATVRGVRAPAVVAGARLTHDRLVLVARAPRRVTLALRLRVRGSPRALRARVRVRRRATRRIALPIGLRGASSATLRVRYRSGGRLQGRRLTVGPRATRFRLPL